MTVDSLCEANNKLPDNNTNYDVNNCPGDSDIFKYKGGKGRMFHFKILIHKYY